MKTRSLKLMALAIAFLALLEGCSFSARLGTTRQPNPAAMDQQKEVGIPTPEIG